MEFTNKILQHPEFHRYIRLNAKAENEIKRDYCHHDLQHAIDVARVAYIISLENSLGLDKDIIYSAALLHDIAKWMQIRDGVDHALEGADLARKILDDIGMDSRSAQMVINAIRCHRVKDSDDAPLSRVLYDADKTCRVCSLCDYIKDCKRFRDGQSPDLKY